MSSHCDPEFLQALLDVEVALAAAEADTGLIPAACLPHIRAAAAPMRMTARRWPSMPLATATSSFLSFDS